MSYLTHSGFSKFRNHYFTNQEQKGEEVDQKESFKQKSSFSYGLKNEFLFNQSIKLALISGAGIAGLAASFELLASGYRVIIAEKRGSFSRTNIINLNIETQIFLRKFGLLKDFEESVAAKINYHKIVHVSRKKTEELSFSDVSQLQLTMDRLPDNPAHFDKLFNYDGIYSVKIGHLQNFLAQKALAAGVEILGEVEIEPLDYKPSGGVATVQIVGKESASSPRLFKPALMMIAEGAHSTNAERLGFTKNSIQNVCSDECWIYGNLPYQGKKSFVISLIDTTEKRLEIMNLIFNAKIQELNIAATSQKNVEESFIKEKMLRIVRQVRDFEEVRGVEDILTSYVNKPVHIKNEIRNTFSKDNLFLVGDTTGHSSPLAGLGGTLSLSLSPYFIERLLLDLQEGSEQVYDHFNLSTQFAVLRWITKSQKIKEFCLKIYAEANQAAVNAVAGVYDV